MISIDDDTLDGAQVDQVYGGPLTMQVTFAVTKLKKAVNLVLNIDHVQGNLLIRDPVKDNYMYTLQNVETFAAKQSCATDTDLARANLSGDKYRRRPNFRHLTKFGFKA